VRILRKPRPGIRDAHPVEHVDHGVARTGTGEPAMQGEHFAKLRADAQVGIERAHRILEHVGDAPAANMAPPRFRQGEQLLALEPCLAADFRTARHQTREREQRLALAGAGFADDSQGIAFLQLEVDAVDRVDHATALMKTHLQAANVEQHQRLHQNSAAPVMLANSTKATAKSNHAGNRLVCRLRAISTFMAAAKIAPESTRSRPRREASFTSGSTQTGAATIATIMLAASLAVAIASSGASMARLATTSSSST